jgi:hypothetical protein
MGEGEYDRPPLASDTCHVALVLRLQVGEVFALTLGDGPTLLLQVAIVRTNGKHGRRARALIPPSRHRLTTEITNNVFPRVLVLVARMALEDEGCF